MAVLDGVHKAFAESTALRGITVAIPAGVVGLLGPNGAGKSTLFRLLLGLDNADTGTVEVLGWPMPESAMEARAEIGFMPEDDSLFPGLNGIEQVVHAARLCGLNHTDAFARAHEMLDLVGLSEARYRAASGFSLGMRQRLRLAMALAHGPRLVFLDEPTAGLDPPGRAEMLALIAEVGRAGTSVLLSTHVLGDVEEVCDHVVLLSRGQTGFVGPMSRFRAGSGHRAVRPSGVPGVPPAATGAHHVVDLVGDVAAVAAALRAAQVPVDIDGDRIRIQLTEGDPTPLWRAAADAGAGIRNFRLEQEGMAEAFVRHLRLDDPTRKAGGA